MLTLSAGFGMQRGGPFKFHVFQNGNVLDIWTYHLQKREILNKK